MVDWTALPADVLEYISSRLTYDADYVRFRCVCTSWRSAAAAAKRLQLPWLVLHHSRSYNFAGLCNFPNPNVFVPHMPEDIEGLNFLCSASSGCIAWMEYNEREHAPDAIYLQNPLTGDYYSLPIWIDLPDIALYDPGTHHLVRNINRMVLSSDPINDDCVILARCFGEWLIRCRSEENESSWTLIWPPCHGNMINDIVFYMGRFYAVSDYRVFVCDTDGDAQLTEILPADPLFPNFSHEIWQYDNSYLLVSSGDLLLVAFSRHWRKRYEVFRIDLEGGQLRLFNLENLGDHALFLGPVSVSLPVDNSSWCKKNWIYEINDTYDETQSGFHETMDIKGRFDRISAFNMEDGSISIINVLSDNYRGSHWFIPSFCY